MPAARHRPRRLGVPRSTPAAPPLAVRAVDACVTCGAPAGTPFCPACGERRAADRPRTLLAVWEEAWDAFSPVDGRVGRTLWTLLRRPGELTAAYVRGVRRPYVPPLRLFLLVNVLFFLYASAVGNHTFDTPLSVHLNATKHRGIARALVHRKLERIVAAQPNALAQARAVADWGRRFDENSTTQAKSLVIVLVPLLALALGALEWRRGDYRLRDVAFAFHAMSVLLLAFVAVPWLVGAPLVVALNAARLPVRWLDLDAIASVLIVAPVCVWLALALRRAYGDGRAMSWAKAVALCAALLPALFAYRALLFFTVYFTT